MSCHGEPRIGWFRDGTIHVWCSECDAEIVRRVALPLGIEWVDTDQPDGDGSRYPMLRPDLRDAIERAAGERYMARFASHAPTEPRFRFVTLDDLPFGPMTLLP